jgi:hypothetical protein
MSEPTMSDSSRSAAAWRPGPPDDRYRDDRALCPAEPDAAIEDLLPIVVGSHLKAEFADRPLAERLRRLILSWQAAVLEPDDVALLPVVVSDAWFLNDRDLMRQPSIAIGAPGVNAASAHYAVRLPKSLVVEGVLCVQFDPEHLDGSVCLWGATPAGTESAVEAFAERHLDRYLRSMHGVE